jgi:hypothetical protein
MSLSKVAFLFQIYTLVCSSEVVAPSHRIGVRTVDGAGVFYLRDSGAVFIPRGNNYIRLGQQTHYPGYGPPTTYHSLFNVGVYDTADVETQLSLMQSDGITPFGSGLTLVA